jgi:hypothetical protein
MAITTSITQDTHAEWRHYKSSEVKVIDNLAIRFRDVKVYEFKMGDVDDPDLYASQPLHEWSQTECGKWCIEHAVEPPYWVRSTDPASYGYRYLIMARLSEQNETFWQLKWGNK